MYVRCLAANLSIQGGIFVALPFQISIHIFMLINTSVLPVDYYYIIRKVTFIKNLLFTNNVVILTLYNTVAKSEISTCAVKFKCEEQNFNWKYRSRVHDNFKSELGL